MQDPDFLSPERFPYVGLYSTKNGISAVGSPAKVQILGMLARNEMAFEEVVAHSGRAKSTISVHLGDLADAGIVGARTDPLDGRKKIFYLDSLFLGSADTGEKGGFNIDRYIRKEIPCEGNPASLYRFILSTIRLNLINQGITIDPVLHLAGLNAGGSLYHCVADPVIDRMIDRMGTVWEKNGLGEVELERKTPLTLNIRDCFECIDLPIMGKPACAFESGVLSSLFSLYYGQQMKAIESHCYAMGSNLCRFEVRDLPVRMHQDTREDLTRRSDHWSHMARGEQPGQVSGRLP
jgi:predicted hydrocarbon binding protein